MPQSNYMVYVGTTSAPVSIDPNQSLATLRTQLGSQVTNSDVFLYFNPVTQQKTVLPITDESTVDLLPEFSTVIM